MSWWTKLREYDRRGLFQARRDGWKLITPTGYVFDRRLFIGFMVVVVFGALVLLSQVGIKDYRFVSCPNDSMSISCENPFYQQCTEEVCRYPVVMRGNSFGERPPGWLTNVYWYVIAGMAVVFLLNHFLFNKSFEFSDGENNE